MLSGGEIIVQVLKEYNTDTVFGYPGATVLSIYDALNKQKDITHILTCHEQHAVHAAHGYSVACGKTGVVIATSGPGATNLVTGIATAYMDSVPLVVITGNVELKDLGKDSFQEVDISGITAPVVKHNTIVKDIKDLANAIRTAFEIANSNRKGPVLIDVPKDITTAYCEYTKEAKREYTHKNLFAKEDIRQVAKAINASKKPFILAGGGAKYFKEELTAFAKKANAPIGTTLMGIGIPKTKGYAGLTGVNGTKSAAMCMRNCDLLIGIGTRFSQKVLDVGFKGRVIHIDIDPAEINKNIEANYELIGDGGEILKALTPLIKTKNTWLDEVCEYIQKHPIEKGVDVYAKKLFGLINEHTSNVNITTDVGLHQLWAAKCLDISADKTFITSGGLGTMGFGLGSAIGACIATGKTSLNITGDGSFYMSLQEISTAVALNLSVKIVMLDNNCLGLVKDWQKKMCGSRYYQTNLTKQTDYVMLANALGAKGVEVKKGDYKAFVRGLKEEGCVLIHCITNAEENKKGQD